MPTTAVTNEFLTRAGNGLVEGFAVVSMFGADVGVSVTIATEQSKTNATLKTRAVDTHVPPM